MTQQTDNQGRSFLGGAPVLHIHAQAMWHDSAYLVGTRDALLALRDAIDAALEHGRAACAVYTNDGEGYETVVRFVGDRQVEKLGVPYTDDCARERWEKNPHVVSPWDLDQAA